MMTLLSTSVKKQKQKKSSQKRNVTGRPPLYLPSHLSTNSGVHIPSFLPVTRMNYELPVFSNAAAVLTCQSPVLSLTPKNIAPYFLLLHSVSVFPFFLDHTPLICQHAFPILKKPPDTTSSVSGLPIYLPFFCFSLAEFKNSCNIYLQFISLFSLELVLIKLSSLSKIALVDFHVLNSVATCVSSWMRCPSRSVTHFLIRLFGFLTVEF